MGSIPLGALAGGFLATAFGAQTALLILTGIMARSRAQRHLSAACASSHDHRGPGNIQATN